MACCLNIRYRKTCDDLVEPQARAFWRGLELFRAGFWSSSNGRSSKLFLMAVDDASAEK